MGIAKPVDPIAAGSLGAGPAALARMAAGPPPGQGLPVDPQNYRYLVEMAPGGSGGLGVTVAPITQGEPDDDNDNDSFTGFLKRPSPDGPLGVRQEGPARTPQARRRGWQPARPAARPVARVAPSSSPSLDAADTAQANHAIIP